MNIKDYLKIGLVPLLIGCSSNKYIQNRDYATVSEAMEKLKIYSPQNITYLFEGYKTSDANAVTLRKLAGIRAGTVKVKKLGENYYYSEGEYSYVKNPEALENLVIEADKNEDYIIDDEELNNIEAEVYDSLNL